MSDLIQRLRSQEAVDARPHEIEQLTDEAADLIASLESRVSQQARTIASMCQQVADLAKDSERYRWLAPRFIGADFDWNEQGVKVLCFEIDGDFRVSADVDASIDAANEKRMSECQCRACLRGQTVESGFGPIPVEMTRMIVCAKCGNKRCPHATDHHNECSGSNEPGQRGSVYGPIESDAERDDKTIDMFGDA